MDPSTFEACAEQALELALEKIESTDIESMLDIDLIDGVLTITTPDDNQIVINKHSASKQIWFSSPFSGALYFNYDETNHLWLDEEGRTLQNMVDKDIVKALG